MELFFYLRGREREKVEPKTSWWVFLLMLNSTCLFLLVSYPVACWLSDASSPYDILRAKVMAEFVLSSFSLYSEDASLLSKGKQWGFSYKCKSESECMLFMCYCVSSPLSITSGIHICYIQCWKSTRIHTSSNSTMERFKNVLSFYQELSGNEVWKLQNCFPKMNYILLTQEKVDPSAAKGFKKKKKKKSFKKRMSNCAHDKFI